MKRWIFEFRLEEGADEFWESNPSKMQVYELVQSTLENAHLYVDNIKITKVEEECNYDIRYFVADLEADANGSK